MTQGHNEPPNRRDPPLPAPPPPPPAPGWSDILHNRLILSGLGVIIVLLLIAVVLVAFGGGDDSAASREINRDPDATAEPTFELPRGALLGRMQRSVSLRSGPDIQYAILGTVRRNALVAVVGRNEEASWLQINYPPGSRLRGWVERDFVDVEGNVSALSIEGPLLQPVVPTPTFDSSFSTPIIVVPTEPPEPTPAPTEPPEATPTERPTSPPPATPTDRPTSMPVPTPGGGGGNPATPQNDP